ncbi:hypothetical protein DVH24_013884 [Malus domestica]|uniref:RNase H type-1 domain-containing protein n=1 Tax=Malus domestica TaxID=3750 RepID=A0A498JC47_MALDO|nr:hypothetical protein DVH24_013884 [Malus domestica]
MWLAKAKGLTRIMVEGDLKLVIESISGSYNPPWRLKTILEYIRWLAGSTLPLEAHQAFLFDSIQTGCPNGFSL